MFKHFCSLYHERIVELDQKMKAVEIGMKRGALAMIFCPSDEMLFSTDLSSTLAGSSGVDQTFQQPAASNRPG